MSSFSVAAKRDHEKYNIYLFLYLALFSVAAKRANENDNIWHSLNMRKEEKASNFLWWPRETMKMTTFAFSSSGYLLSITPWYRWCLVEGLAGS